MEHDFKPFLAFWREHQTSFVEDLYNEIVAALPYYASLPREDLVASIESKVDLWHHLFLTGDITPMIERTRALVQYRVGIHFPLLEMVRSGDFVHDHLWRMLQRFYSDLWFPFEIAEQIEEWSRLDRNVILRAYGDELERIRVELNDRVVQLEQQRLLIRELSTPIVPVADNVLVLPLIGPIDARRATQITEETLDRIVATQADLLVLDVTGVPLIDTEAAHHLMLMARAIGMIGAQLMLVGVSAEMAQSIVQLNIDMSSILIRANLQEAIRYTFQLSGTPTN